MEVFHLIPEKKQKFVTLVQETLQSTYVSVKTLQRLVGKCTSFSRAVPAARLFTREMNAAISKGIRSQKPISLRGALREEISHWLYLETWDNPLPSGDERHIQVSVATDASVSGCGAAFLSPICREVFKYWSGEGLTWDIATKEAMAMNKMLWFCRDQVCNAQVDALMDNQVVIHAWNNQGGRSVPLNNALKVLFVTTAELNVLLRLSYAQSAENPADGPSHHLSPLDYR